MYTMYRYIPYNIFIYRYNSYHLSYHLIIDLMYNQLALYQLRGYIPNCLSLFSRRSTPSPRFPDQGIGAKRNLATRSTSAEVRGDFLCFFFATKMVGHQGVSGGFLLQKWIEFHWRYGIDIWILHGFTVLAWMEAIYGINMNSYGCDRSKSGFQHI